MLRRLSRSCCGFQPGTSEYLRRFHGIVAPFGAVDLAVDADEIADIEIGKRGEHIFADLILPEKRLNLARIVAQIHPHALALIAHRDNPARDRLLEQFGRIALRRAGFEGLEAHANRIQFIGPRKEILIRFIAPVAQALHLRDAELPQILLRRMMLVFLGFVVHWVRSSGGVG